MYFLKKLILPALFAALTLPAQVVPLTKRLTFATDNPKQSALDSLVDRSATNFMQHPQNCGISIGIFKNGNTWFYNYGETKRGSNTLPTDNTIYEIGPLTATFCGILLAQAVAEHKVTLEDDIRNYLPGKYPDLDFNEAPIQLKHLANHTSGLPNVPPNLQSEADYDSLNPYKHYTEEQIYNYLKVVQLSAEPGLETEYSNLGMALLGQILETIYNKPFEELVKEKICHPNKMKSTAVNVPAEQVALLASGYNKDGNPTPAWELGAFIAAGGLKSSTADMLTYLEYNLHDKTGPAMMAQVPAFRGRQTLGLSWFIKATKPGNTLVWHNGGTYGFSGFCGFIKEKNCAVIILTNSSASVDYIGIPLLNYLQQ